MKGTTQPPPQRQPTQKSYIERTIEQKAGAVRRSRAGRSIQRHIKKKKKKTLLFSLEAAQHDHNRERHHLAQNKERAMMMMMMKKISQEAHEKHGYKPRKDWNTGHVHRTHWATRHFFFQVEKKSTRSSCDGELWEFRRRRRRLRSAGRRISAVASGLAQNEGRRALLHARSGRSAGRWRGRHARIDAQHIHKKENWASPDPREIGTSRVVRARVGSFGYDGLLENERTGLLLLLRRPGPGPAALKQTTAPFALLQDLGERERETECSVGSSREGA